MKRSRSQQVEPLVAELARPVIEARLLELVDVEFVKEGSERYLRLYIDKVGGVDVDDCEAVSRHLSAKLDELDPIPENYFLEVSSPGIERALKKEQDFVRFQGEQIACNLFKALEGKKKWIGALIKLEADQIHLKLDNGSEMAIPREACSKVHLHVDF